MSAKPILQSQGFRPVFPWEKKYGCAIASCLGNKSISWLSDEDVTRANKIDEWEIQRSSWYDISM